MKQFNETQKKKVMIIDSCKKLKTIYKLVYFLKNASQKPNKLYMNVDTQEKKNSLKDVSKIHVYK